MMRIDTPTALPGGVFTDGDPDLDQPATDLRAAWCQHLQDEVCNVIGFDGTLINPSSYKQLLFAIERMIDKAGVSNFPAFFAFTGSPIAEPGYVACDGRLLSTIGCPVLYNKIGNTYAYGRPTPPANTFYVPNFSGRVPLGAGSGPGLTPRPAGSWGGSETHTLSVEQLPEHTVTTTLDDHQHGVTIPDHTHTGPDFKNLLKDPYDGALTGSDHDQPDEEMPVGGGDGGPMIAAGGGTFTTAAAGGGDYQSAPVGGGDPIDHMPPYVTGYWYIKVGLFDNPAYPIEEG